MLNFWEALFKAKIFFRTSQFRKEYSYVIILHGAVEAHQLMFSMKMLCWNECKSMAKRFRLWSITIYFTYKKLACFVSSSSYRRKLWLPFRVARCELCLAGTSFYVFVSIYWTDCSEFFMLNNINVFVLLRTIWDSLSFSKAFHGGKHQKLLRVLPPHEASK